MEPPFITTVFALETSAVESRKTNRVKIFFIIVCIVLLQKYTKSPFLIYIKECFAIFAVILPKNQAFWDKWKGDGLCFMQ